MGPGFDWGLYLVVFWEGRCGRSVGGDGGGDGGGEREEVVLGGKDVLGRKHR